MLSRLRSLAYFYRITKKTNGPEGKPLPNMDKYYLTDDKGSEISFWNGIPYFQKGDLVTACIQIPKQLCNKFQVIKEEKNHPLMQDTRKNIRTKDLQLRYYARYPLFNYGFIPRTWQQNLTKDELGLFGDDDPIDICDLSKGKKEVGDVFKAKVLGCFCLIDQGEVDWKVLMVDAEEAQSEKINDLSHYPKQQIQAVMQWFKTIKVFDGKKPNQIAYNQKIFSKDESLKIINDTHHQWKKLVSSPEKAYSQIRQKFHLNNLKLQNQ